MPPKQASTTSGSGSASAADLRAARLAATEARLRGTPTAEPSSSAAAAVAVVPVLPPWQPSEKGDNEKRKEYTRLLYRGIVRDNGYKQASDCLETLSKIAGNILANPDQAKYREFRAANAGVKAKVLNARGGHEYLIALGFRTRTVSFEKQYILEPTLKRIHELKIGHEVLTEALPEVQARVNGLSTSNTSHASEEAMRRQRALAEYEADRDLVKERVRREKVAREAREAAAAAAAAAEQAAQASQEEVAGSQDEQGQQQDAHDDEDDDDEDEGYGDFRRQASKRTKWGQGHKLGGPDDSAGAGVDKGEGEVDEGQMQSQRQAE